MSDVPWRRRRWRRPLCSRAPAGRSPGPRSLCPSVIAVDETRPGPRGEACRLRGGAGAHPSGMRKRKRCPYCRCLFTPDGRVAKRQWACTKEPCQVARRSETQRTYRRRHVAEPRAQRLRAALAAAKSGEVGPAPRAPPAGIDRFPWEELRDEISPQGYVIAKLFVRLVLERARDETRSEVRDMRTQFGRLLGPVPRDETAPPARTG